MLSKKAKYALQALQYLANERGHSPTLISELARKERIPKKFLELILLELKRHGVLQSKKGKGGGYFLGKSPAEINLGYVIRLLDGPLAPLPCVSQTAYMKCQECHDETTCGIRLVMKEVRDATAEILDGTSLADMLKNVARLQANGRIKTLSRRKPLQPSKSAKSHKKSSTL
ncbi:MAG: RrF2 family transcriptional regulator [bacterium]